MKRQKISFLTFLLFSFFFLSCNFFQQSIEEDFNSKVTSLEFSISRFTLNKGDTDYLPLRIEPNDIQGKITVEYIFDENMIHVISDSYGAVITGLAGGTTFIKASCNGIVATCLIEIYEEEVELIQDPYIYSNDSVLQLTPGDNYTISTSLYGGSVSDMEDFVFTVKDSTIAEITYSRNNCVVKALKNGSTQLVASHPKAKYEYSFVIFISSASFDEPYITTTNNIVSLNTLEKSSAEISVDLVNPLDALYQSGFKWEYVDDSNEYFDFVANCNYATITAKKSGIGKIKVTHTNAQYPLEIIVRTSTIVENVYISASTSTLIVEGSDNVYTVKADIVGYDGIADTEAFEWTFEDLNGNPFNTSDYCSIDISGNYLNIQGKKQISFRAIVSHPLAQYKKKILIILRHQIGNAVDSSVYITTSDNYKQTKVGEDTFTVNVSLVGGLPGDENDFLWQIENGESNEYCRITTTTGHVGARAARNASTSGQYAYANLQVTPLKPGEVKIYVSHPKCLYETEIMIRVYSEYALLSDPVTVTGIPSTLKLLNGACEAVTASLLNAADGDENNIKWESNNSNITVSPDVGASSVITAKETGTYSGYVTVSHDDAISDKRILVMSAETLEELENFKAIYADNTYFRVLENDSIEISVNQIGYGEAYDFSTLSWTVDDNSVCIPEKSSMNPLAAVIKGLHAGYAKITASFESSPPVVFDVTVVPEDESVSVIEPARYLTTSLNAFVLSDIGDKQDISVTGVNISAVDMMNTVWEFDEQGKKAFNVISNGKEATVISNNTGKGILNVSNSKSKNTIQIMAKCGELYEYEEDYIIYIVSESDVYNCIKGDELTIGVTLENFSTGVNPGFEWSIKHGEELASIKGTKEGVCVIDTKQAGQLLISVSNSLAVDTKEILVNINNTEEELRGFRYLTTSQNVITIGEGNSSSVSVNVQNSTSPVIAGYNWVSDNPSICSVVDSGSTAVLYAQKCGTAKIKVSNPASCDYPLEIIVNVVDPILASANPYITSQNIVTCTVGGSAQSVIADLIGGKESDYSNFTWSIVDNNVAALYSSNEQAQITALKEGYTQVIISHPKANATRSILVICEPKSVTDYYISLSDSILKMSPLDSERTITASLINGTSNDEYDFVWWADSYDIINMNYTGGSCVVEPVGSGKTSIHVKHPKVSYQKDILLYISKYSTLSFESNYLDITAGTNSVVKLQVPETGIDTKVSFKVEDSSVAQIQNSTDDMCIIRGVSPGSTKVNAELIAVSSGISQASAQLLVNVKEGDNSIPSIVFNNNTVDTITKGTSKTLNASITEPGQTGNLIWKSNDSSIIKLFNADASGRVAGGTCRLEAVNSGSCTVTISYSDSSYGVQPLTLYFIVPGVNETVLSLNRSSIELVENNDPVGITANVINALEGDDVITWSSSDETVATVSGMGKKVSVVPVKHGNCTITAITGKSNKIATCEVNVTEAPSAYFYIKNDDNSIEKITSLNITPCDKSKKTIYYDVTPSEYADNVTGTLSENTYCTVNLKPSSKQLTVLPTKFEGNAIYTINANGIKQSLNIRNSWNYKFSINKSNINLNLSEGNYNSFSIDYEISPATARIKIEGFGNDNNLTIQNYNPTYSNTSGDGRYYVITNHEKVYYSTNSASGSINFTINKECIKSLRISAVNPDANSIVFSNKNVDVLAYFQKHDVSFNVLGSSGKYDANCAYRKFNDNSIIIGDGESIRIDLRLNSIYSSGSDRSFVINPNISFTGSSNSLDSGKLVFTQATGLQLDETLRTACYLRSDLDYGNTSNSEYYWKSGLGKDSINNMTPDEGSFGYAVEFKYVGDIKIQFDNVNGFRETFCIPVYLEIRNCPAYSDYIQY